MTLAAILIALLAPGTIRIPVAPAETLNVEVTGQGDPVLLLPGMIGNAASFRRTAALMAASGRQAIIIEPLGVGASSRPTPADYSLAAQADRVAAVLESLGIERAVVVGHLMGGALGFRLAWRHPERVAALVTLEGGPAESVVTPGFRRAMKLAPIVVRFGGAGAIRGKIRGELKKNSADDRWLTEEALNDYLAPAERDIQSALRAFRAMGESAEPEPLAPHLSEIRCPIQLLVGGAPHDGGVPPAELALLRRRLPEAVTLSVPDCGLYIQEEQPAVVVTAVQRAERMMAASLAANSIAHAGHPAGAVPTAGALNDRTPAGH